MSWFKVPTGRTPFVAICEAGVGDTFMMSIVLQHLKKKFPDSFTVLFAKQKYSGLFAGGQNHIDAVCFKLPAKNKIEFLKEMQAIAGDKVYYYDLFHDRPDLAPWPGAVWAGHAIFDRYKNAMPDPDIKDLNMKDYLPTAIENSDADKIAKKLYPKNGKRVIIEYQPVSFYPPVKYGKWTNLMSGLMQEQYECMWMASKKHSPLAIGTDGRGIPFDVSRSIIKQSDGFVGIGSGLTCLACTVPNVNKVEIQNNGIYCWKTVCPKSRNHYVVNPKSYDLFGDVLKKLKS